MKTRRSAAAPAGGRCDRWESGVASCLLCFFK
jgi:hypothetical protein